MEQAEAKNEDEEEAEAEAMQETELGKLGISTGLSRDKTRALRGRCDNKTSSECCL